MPKLYNSENTLFGDILDELLIDKVSKNKHYLITTILNKLNGVRNSNDFYRTPSEAIINLLETEKFVGTIWEPACGDGAISKVLEEYGYQVYSSDLIDYGYGEHGINFLKTYRTVNNIVTNPPFKNSLYFIGQAKQCAKNKIAFLLPLQFLESKERYEMFHDKEFPLKCIYQFSNRINCMKTKKKGGMIAFAWFIWDKEYTGKPYINWIL